MSDSTAINTDVICFARDAGLYAKLLRSQNPRDFIRAYHVQEGMRRNYPKQICDEFFEHCGGEIKKI